VIKLGVEDINETMSKNTERLPKTNLDKITSRRPFPAGHKEERDQAKHHYGNFRQIFILAFDALRERKARSILTILMVVTGGGLMVALNGMSAGVASLINKQLSILAPNVLFVSPGQINFRGGPSPPSTLIFNSEVVNRIKSLPYVQEVIPTYQGQFELNAQGNIITTPVLAMDPTKLHLISPSLELVPGSLIQENNPSGMIVGDTIANPPGKTDFVTVGQNIKATYSFADPTTGKLQHQSRSFVISAIMQPSGNSYIDRSVIINLPTGNSLFKKGGKYDQMAVIALSGDYVNAVQQEITSLYGSNNIGVTTPKAIIKTIQGAQGGSSSFQTGIAFIALLVGAVGIITTLYTSVNERIKEIGTMKAIGAKSRFILALFLSEALIIGLLGSTLGLLTGVAGAYVLTSGMLGSGGGSGGTPGSEGGGGGGSTPHFAPIFLPNDLLNVWFLSLSLSLAAGVYPAWKASRLSPLEALRR
jgi:putative ABC transport system permease protein